MLQHAAPCLKSGFRLPSNRLGRLRLRLAPKLVSEGVLDSRALLRSASLPSLHTAAI